VSTPMRDCTLRAFEFPTDTFSLMAWVAIAGIACLFLAGVAGMLREKGKP
jgi:hypothetical protein